MAIDLLADEPEGIDLLADEQESSSGGKKRSFYDYAKADQERAMNLARQQISQQYPNVPNWLRDMMLSIAPKDNSPGFQRIAQEAENQTNFIPVAAGGLTQGLATPFQGVASFVPGQTASDFANEDFTKYFSQPRNSNEKLVQSAAEITGALGPLGKLFGALKGGAQLARVPKALQNASALVGTGAIATPGDAGDKSLGAAGALALGGAGKLGSAVAKKTAEKVPQFLRGLTNDSTEQAVIDAVQKPHDVLKDTADQLYDYVKGAIKRRNISVPLKQQYIDEAKAVLPKTRATTKLIDDAKNGDYEAIHDLQSHLYKKGTHAMASDDLAASNQGEEIIELRNKINDDVNDHLIQNGHVDIAHVLQQGRGAYKQLMDTYFNKNLPKGIGKMVQQDLRVIPENVKGLFNQNSKPMKQFLKQHPEASTHIKGLEEKEAAKKALDKILLSGAGIGGGIYGAQKIHDFLQ